jgi:hypothetical protein
MPGSVVVTGTRMLEPRFTGGPTREEALQAAPQVGRRGVGGQRERCGVAEIDVRRRDQPDAIRVVVQAHGDVDAAAGAPDCGVGRNCLLRRRRRRRRLIVAGLLVAGAEGDAGDEKGQEE